MKPPPTTAAFLRVIAALAGCGVSVDAPDTDGASPLHLAARYGLGEVARTLVSLGACHVLHVHGRVCVYVWEEGEGQGVAV